MNYTVQKALFTKKEAALYLSRSASTIDRLRNEGKLLWVKVRGSIMFRRKDLEAYVEALS
jgi:excisionase family DNA binding protein